MYIIKLYVCTLSLYVAVRTYLFVDSYIFDVPLFLSMHMYVGLPLSAMG